MTSSALPVAVKAVSGTGNLSGVTQLSGRAGHFCARINTGKAVCWGNNSNRQLGDGTTAVSRPRPVLVKPPVGVAGPALTGVAEVAAGGIHSCARLNTGQVRCWGANIFGGIGDTTTTNRNRPTPVRATSGAGNLTGVAQLSLGLAHSCARLNNAEVRCWGDNSVGELGIGSTTLRARPGVVQAIGGGGRLTNVTQLSARADGVCVRRTDNTAVCWGANSSSQVGDGTTTTRTVPTLVGGIGGQVKQVAAGAAHGCTRLGTSTLVCWGNNVAGQLGDGSQSNRTTPVPVQL